MILSIRVDNFLVYSNLVELSLTADMHIKKFGGNIFRCDLALAPKDKDLIAENDLKNQESAQTADKKGQFNILKSVCIYGANNSGKTCLIRALQSIKNVMLGLDNKIMCNLFTNKHIASLGITFMAKGGVYSYDFCYDTSIANGYKNGFIYECLQQLSIDRHKNVTAKELFIRDTVNEVYRFSGNKELSSLLGAVSSDNILIYTISGGKYPIIEEYKSLLRDFANDIEILDMNNIPLNKTISVLKNDEKIREKTVELIKQADLEIENYYYKKDVKVSVSENLTEKPIEPREDVIRLNVILEDILSLTSVHKGREVKSLYFDSTGTKKMVAVASFIIDAIYNGKVLVVDELDSSLHFKLTRSIVALFNNELNKNAQLIFTAHDATLLDCKKLFRKDQIWFASKDTENEYLYSLVDFNAKENKIRAETDLFEKYNLGLLGAVPEPDLISVLLDDKAKLGGDENE